MGAYFRYTGYGAGGELVYEWEGLVGRHGCGGGGAVA